MNGPIPLRPDYAELERQQQRAWTRAITAHVLATLHNEYDVAKVLRSNWPGDARAEMVLRAAQSPTSTSGYPAFDQVAAFKSLAPGSAATELFARSGNKLNLAGLTTIRIPHVAGLPPSEVFIAEGLPAPVLNFTFAATVVGPVRKILVLSAVSGELENAGPELASQIIGRVLADGAAKSLDLVAFGFAAGDAAKPPGLLYNAIPITATAGGGLNAMQTDLTNMVAAIAAAGIDASNVVFVAGAREATLIKLYAGPKFDFEVLVTLGLPAKTIAAFAPSAVFFAYDGTPSIETGRGSVLHMEDTNPTDITTTGTPPLAAFPAKSMFQSNLIAIRLRANCAWAVHPGGAQVIDPVSW